MHSENVIYNPNRIIPNERRNQKASKKPTRISKNEKVILTVPQIEQQVQVSLNTNQKKVIDNGYIYTYCLQKSPEGKDTFFLQQKIVLSADFHAILNAPLREEFIAMSMNIYPQYDKLNKASALALKRVKSINSSIWASLGSIDQFMKIATVDNVVRNTILNKDLIEVNVREEILDTNLKNSLESERKEYGYLVSNIRKILKQRIINLCSGSNTDKLKTYSKIIEEKEDIKMFERVFDKVTQNRKEKSVSFVRF